MRIQKILQNARDGKTHTHEDVMFVEEYIRTTTLMVGDGSIEIDEQLQELFPMEWNGVQDELEAEERGDTRP